MRTRDLRAFRQAILELTTAGSVRDARDRLVVVPTRAAALHLTRSLESRRLGAEDAIVLPEFVTRAELYSRLAQRLPSTRPSMSGAEREVLMARACRLAEAAGSEAPFRLRPGLVAAILDFYDTLHRNGRDIATFERRALDMLEPGALEDRGAERLVRQTHFLARAFRFFEQLRGETGSLDEHLLRQQLLEEVSSRPWRHIVVTVTDRGFDPNGLYPVDWDLLARVPGLQQLELAVTDSVLAGALHERIHHLLPGMEEIRFQVDEAPTPVLLGPSKNQPLHTARDREEEVAGFARWVKGNRLDLDATALVVRRPLPYMYLAREVLRSAGIPSRMFDALPLAAEPFAAALNLVLEFVNADFARLPAISLLRSPHFHLGSGVGGPSLRAVAALDRALTEKSYLGDVESLERIVATWDKADRPSHAADVRAAAVALLEAARELLPLRALQPAANHLDGLLQFALRHEQLPALDDPLRPRLLRGRAAVLEVLTGLRNAYARFDASPTSFVTLAATIRRWIEDRTFAPYTGEAGLHVVDADSALFGEFAHVQIAGAIDGEWPETPRRDIFYPPVLLRELGWPSEKQRLDHSRAAFGDLLRLPSKHLVVSAFSLEDDAPVTPSPFVDALEGAGLEIVEQAPLPARIFDWEALALEPVDVSYLSEDAQAAAARRVAAIGTPAGHLGTTSSPGFAAYAVSALEKYQDCPFKFFATGVLGLEEPAEDESISSPRVHGRFVHEVLQRFFEAWQAHGGGAITTDRLAAARKLFDDVAEPMLARLPDSDAALERVRFFGSAATVGIVDVILGLEASRPLPVQERWLEYRLEGAFSLGNEGRRVDIRGVADRIDLLDGKRLRVIDYKSGSAPNPARALQAAVYALCAQERLQEGGRGTWVIDEAVYIALSGRKTVIPVVRAGGNDSGSVLSEASARLFAVVDGIEAGQFPVRPFDPRICTYCAYPSVCRKDYVGDD